MEEKYKLSAIVLVYNGEKYLRECLNSLVNQSLEELEIILVNDASTDDSLSICREYEINYDNVKIIDKEINKGLSDSANIGIQEAQGEYIILVDNDDIIPYYAYEKLYNKAKISNADISIGKANFLVGKYQYEMKTYVSNVWRNEKVIKSAKDFLILFNDAFYWNKIIKRSLILDNNIELGKGMIYADRKFVHTCFVYANTIAIIEDCVYMWRQLSSGHNTSLSMKRTQLNNFINRIDSYESDLNLFMDYDPNYIKILMRRIFVPIQGILESDEFKKEFFKSSYNLLSRESKKVKSLYDNDLPLKLNLYVYMILNNLKTPLVNFLKGNTRTYKGIISENGNNYWNHPYFRNDELNIPDELFKIKFLETQFINFEEIIASDDCIELKNIEINKNLPIGKGEIVLEGRSEKDEILDSNKSFFTMKPITTESIDTEPSNKENESINKFNVIIPLDKLDAVQEYNLYFQFRYSNEGFSKFRIFQYNFENIVNNSESVDIYLTNDKLSLSTLLLDDLFEISLEKSGLYLNLAKDKEIKKDLKVSLKNRIIKEKVYLDRLNNNKTFMIEWKYFLDNNPTYDLYLEYGDKEIRFSERFISKIKSKKIRYRRINIEVYKTNKGNISLKSK
jgi:glycosyltransferase involved in cell wall biosynthesis